MPQRAGSGRLRAEWWFVALLSSALLLVLIADRTAARLDNLVYDSLLRLLQHEPIPDILIVAIDNRSLREAGPWPWPRDRHARLIETLAAARPKAIGYDVLFVEPGPSAADDRLGQAMAASGSVFVPLLLNVPGRNGAAFDAIEPIDPVRRAAAGIGHANLSFDRDGLVRRIFLAEGDGRRQWLQLAELVRRRTGRGTGVPLQEEPQAQGLLVARYPAMFAYAGPPGQFPTVSASAVLRGEVPPELLRGRLILVGATADGLGDQYPVPLGNRDMGVMPGVEIHANLLDAMITDRLIRPVPPLLLAVVSLVPLWVLLAAFRRLRPRANIILLLALLGMMAGVSAIGLAAGFWFPPSAAIIALALVYPLWGWRRLEAVSSYMTAELEQFRAEPDLLPRRPDEVAATDLVARQAMLLHQSIGRMRDVRRFALDRLRQLPDATLVSDRDGHVLLANEEAVRLQDLLVVPQEERSSLSGLLARLHYGDGAGTDQAPVLPAEGLAGETSGGEVVSADGRAFDLRFAPQHAEDGTLTGWIVRIVDISEAKALQRQREHILQLLTHDMRSPQASILAIIDDAAGGIDAAGARRIEGYARRTLALADDFVQLARAEALDYEMEELALGDVVIDAADDLWPQSSVRGIAVEVAAPDEPLLVMGERSLLTRVFVNLIGNAIKYSGDGKRIQCRLMHVGGLVVCTIRDDGIGIAPDHLDHLFERFRRAPSGEGQRIEGVGLGLAFVHTVVTRHQGMIRCESVVGRGSCFTIELPALAS
ncbi:CHASE2 domain-containing protein [Flavisphingomonas formosensis]|uniref:CHASE2 domain-containing protein n=1 Tax=Flavisphingomonas formosensis TaxID=861534 RepID=UPI0012F79D56|nr:CHASE2 domain-containing protein [Sphingomonas formosensis]